MLHISISIKTFIWSSIIIYVNDQLFTLTTHWGESEFLSCKNMTKVLVHGTTSIDYGYSPLQNAMHWQSKTLFLWLWLQCFVGASNQIFHYTCCITPKRVTSLQAHLRVIAPGQHSSLRRNVASVASRWQHCVQFDGPEI